MRKKQKTTFDRDELCHIWSSQSQPYGKAKTTNMHFQDGALYSYNTVIGRICKYKGKQYVLVNTHTFGPTTSKHYSSLRGAVSHMKQFRGDWGSYETRLSQIPIEIVAHYREGAEKTAKKTSRYRHKMYDILVTASHRYGEAIEAAEFFGFGVEKLKQARSKCQAAAKEYEKSAEEYKAKSDERRNNRHHAQRVRREQQNAQWAQEAAESLAAFLADHTVEHVPTRYSVSEDQLEAYNAQLSKRRKWENEEAESELERWTKGEPSRHIGRYSLPVRLRVNPEDPKEIKTSHGAVIPYEDGKRCFQFVMRMRGRAWRRNGETFQVGPYQLDSITEDGSIIAGCHRIDHQTIIDFATKEGWVQLTELSTSHE